MYVLEELVNTKGGFQDYIVNISMNKFESEKELSYSNETRPGDENKQLDEFHRK